MKILLFAVLAFSFAAHAQEDADLRDQIVDGAYYSNADHGFIRVERPIFEGRMTEWGARGDIRVTSDGNRIDGIAGLRLENKPSSKYLVFEYPASREETPQVRVTRITQELYREGQLVGYEVASPIRLKNRSLPRKVVSLKELKASVDLDGHFGTFAKDHIAGEIKNLGGNLEVEMAQPDLILLHSEADRAQDFTHEKSVLTSLSQRSNFTGTETYRSLDLIRRMANDSKLEGSKDVGNLLNHALDTKADVHALDVAHPLPRERVEVLR